MATNGAPDNWEDEDMDVSNKLSALNVNAATFVPNPNAAVFVPSWGPEAAAPKSENKDNGKMAVDEPSPVEAGPPPLLGGPLACLDGVQHRELLQEFFMFPEFLLISAGGLTGSQVT